MRRRFGWIALILVAASWTTQHVAAQAPENPAFEVAVLRMSTPPVTGISPYGSGRWSARSINLSYLLQLSFDLRVGVQPITGLPDWGRSDYYSIDAKAEDGVILTTETLRPHLKRLVEERFKLVAHMETRNMKGYALVLATGGPKLKPTTDPPAMTALGSGMVRSPSVTMDLLARSLENLLRLEMREGLPVVNETGLSGNYDVALSFAPLVDAGILPRETNSSLPSLFTALQEQLGLRLISRDEIPVPVLVIDHVEHPTVD